VAIFVLFLIIYFVIRSINAGQNASFDKGDVIIVRDNPLVFSEKHCIMWLFVKRSISSRGERYNTSEAARTLQRKLKK
jgi:hypothetical protein